MRIKPEFLRASVAFDENLWVCDGISWGVFLEFECIAEVIAITPSVIDAMK
jgi:hypothetical protein